MCRYLFKVNNGSRNNVTQCIRFVLDVFNTPKSKSTFMAAFDSTQHPCAGPSERGGAGGQWHPQVLTVIGEKVLLRKVLDYFLLHLIFRPSYGPVLEYQIDLFIAHVFSLFWHREIAVTPWVQRNALWIQNQYSSQNRCNCLFSL